MFKTASPLGSVAPRALFATCLCVAPVSGQESKTQPARMERGTGHVQLDRLVGSWRTHHVMTFEGDEYVVDEIESYRWIEPTRVWLKKEVSNRNHPIVGQMNGLDLWSYDEEAGEYLNYWFDNQSPEVFPHRGGWTDDDTLVMNGTIEWEGRTVHMRNVFSFDGPDHFVLVHSQSWDTDSDFRVRSTVDYQRVNQESDAPPTSTAEARRAWREHLADLADGVWMTSNASFQGEDEGIDEYGMAFTLQPSGLSATGCLWQQRDGAVDAVAWEFFMGWDPTEQAGFNYQSNASGMIAAGFLKDRGAGEPELIQELETLDGNGVRIGHFEEMDGADRRLSRSVRWEEGAWTPQRSYTWVRIRKRSNPC